MSSPATSTAVPAAPIPLSTFDLSESPREIAARATGGSSSVPAGGPSGVFSLLEPHARYAVLRHRAWQRLRRPGAPAFGLHLERFVRFNTMVARLERAIAIHARTR